MAKAKAQKRPPTPRQARFGNVVAVAFGLVVVVAVVVSLVRGKDDKPGQTDGVDDSFSAQEACHQRVASSLKSPSSAGFESYDEASFSHDGDVWTVAGHVDSENGFGATVRTIYSCTATKNPGVLKSDDPTWSARATLS